QEAVHTASVRDANEALTRGEDPVASRAFALLSGHLVEEACLVLVKGGDRHLANLVAQAGQDSAVCQLIADQLARWNKLKVSEHMPRETLRVLSLLSGNTRRAVVDGEKGKQEFLVGEGLDWKRAFGLELWYGQYRHDGVRECVLEFDSSWTDSVSAAPALRVAPPVPWYVEEAGTNNLDGPAVVRMPRDAPWELLQLYSQPERPLDLVCQPAGFSSDLMDYRMPWLLYTKLSGSLAVREFMDVESEHGSRLAEYITASLSFQLENLGLWHWAVFVSLHHVQPDMREKAVRELIFRNVPACNEDQSEEWQERVRFLRETLHIPASWLYEAKALRARYEGDVREETLALLAAGRHAAAHMRIVMILAPEMIMKGSFDELVQLLKAVDPQEVPNWQAEGKMYLNYVEVVDKVPKVVARGAEPADVLEMKERLQLLLKLVSDAMGAKRSEGYPFASVQFDLRRNVALADMAANLSNSLQDLESLVGFPFAFRVF
ncbi:MAG: nuclear protein 96-domain-containing protein, partial [Olpidium bornovanus]